MNKDEMIKKVINLKRHLSETSCCQQGCATCDTAKLDCDLIVDSLESLDQPINNEVHPYPFWLCQDYKCMTLKDAAINWSKAHNLDVDGGWPMALYRLKGTKSKPVVTTAMEEFIEWQEKNRIRPVVTNELVEKIIDSVYEKASNYHDNTLIIHREQFKEVVKEYFITALKQTEPPEPYGMRIARVDKTGKIVFTCMTAIVGDAYDNYDAVVSAIAKHFTRLPEMIQSGDYRQDVFYRTPPKKKEDDNA